MNFCAKLITCFAFISLFACSVQQPRPDNHDAQIRNIINASISPLLMEYDVPGMAVAITIDGQSHFFSYGVASREANLPVTEHTIFELGSVSKTFTGTLASYALAVGKLSLKDRPGRYIPSLYGSAIDQASLLHLGTYTAGGLPLQFPADVSDDESMIPYFAQWQPDAKPGLQRRYSNPSIGLLGHIAGLVLAGDFAAAMETQLLPRLGLRDTYIDVPENVMRRYAWGYNSANEPVRVNPGVLDDEAYGIKSTAADMLSFVQSNIDPSSLGEPIHRAVAETHISYFKVGEMLQGLGWEQYPYPITLERLLAGNSGAMILEANVAESISSPQTAAGPTLFNKTGSTNGFGAYVAFVPERKIGIVMLANKNYPIPARVTAAYTILEKLALLAR